MYGACARRVRGREGLTPVRRRSGRRRSAERGRGGWGGRWGRGGRERGGGGSTRRGAALDGATAAEAGGGGGGGGGGRRVGAGVGAISAAGVRRSSDSPFRPRRAPAGSPARQAEALLRPDRSAEPVGAEAKERCGLAGRCQSRRGRPGGRVIASAPPSGGRRPDLSTAIRQPAFRRRSRRPSGGRSGPWPPWLLGRQRSGR